MSPSYLKDTGIHKIRAFEDYEGVNLRTFWYEEDGTKHASSQVHTPESVLGVVKYKGKYYFH